MDLNETQSSSECYSETEVGNSLKIAQFIENIADLSDNTEVPLVQKLVKFFEITPQREKYTTYISKKRHISLPHTLIDLANENSQHVNYFSLGDDLIDEENIEYINDNTISNFNEKEEVIQNITTESENIILPEQISIEENKTIDEPISQESSNQLDEIETKNEDLIPQRMWDNNRDNKKKSNVVIGVRSKTISVVNHDSSKYPRDAKSIKPPNSPIKPTKVTLSKIRISSKLERSSNSRQKVDTIRLFDYFAIVGLGDQPIVEERASDPLYSLYKPIIISRYPEINFDIPLPPQLWMFCFPGGISLLPKTIQNESIPPEFFFFTLTEIDGARFYGSCLIFYESLNSTCISNLYKEKLEISNPNILAPKCLCILSHYPHFRVFKECLMEMYHTINRESSVYPIEYLLRVTHEVMVPPTSLRLSFTFGQKKIEMTTVGPKDLKIHDFNIRSLFTHLGVERVLELFTCILFEQKICIYSTYNTHLTIACEILVSLLDPFKWPHVFIPILPRWLLEFLQAPTAFIMGLHSSYLIDCNVDNEIVYVDLDNRKLTIPPTCNAFLPPEKFLDLAARLKKILEFSESNDKDPKVYPNSFELVSDNSDKFYEIEIKISFQIFFADLFKSYARHILYLRRFPEPLKVFNKSSFLREINSNEDEMFLKSFINTQLFSVFLEDIDRRPKGAFDDMIEIRNLNPNDKSYTLEKQILHGRKTSKRKTLSVPQSPPVYPITFSYIEKTISKFDSNLVYPENILFNLDALLYDRLESYHSSNCIKRGRIGELSSTKYQELSPNIEKYFEEFEVPIETPFVEDNLLSSFKLEKHDFSSRLSQSIDLKIIQFMNDRIEQLFTSSPINGINLALLMDFFKIDNGRVLFSKLLLQRHELSKELNKSNDFSISKSSYDLLCNLILEILTEANLNSDFISASSLMNVSCIYYYVDTNTLAIHYLHEITRKHKIWSNNQYWESTFYNMIQSHRIKLYQNIQSNELFSSFAEDLNKSNYNINNLNFFANFDWDKLDAKQKEFCVVSEENLIFKVLSYFVNNMLLFGKSANVVRRFIGRISSSANLDFDKIDTLEILIDNLDQFLRSNMDVITDDSDLFDYCTASITKTESAKKGNIKELYQRIMEAQRATGRSAMKKCDLVKSKEFFGSRASFNEVNQPSHLTITVQYEEDDDFSIAVLRGNTTGIEAMEMEGGLAVTGSSNGVLMIWDIRNNFCCKQIFAHNNRISCLSFKEDLVVTGSADQSVRIWDIESGMCKHSLTDHTGSITKLQIFSNIIISSSFDNTIKFCDIRMPQTSVSLAEHNGPVNTFKFENNILVSGSRDTTVKSWDIRYLKSMYTFKDHKDWLTAVDFDFQLLPNSFISSSYDGTLKLFDMINNTCDRTYYGHKGSVNCFDFTSNFLVSGSSDLTSKLWHIDTTKCLQTFKGHSDEVIKINFLDESRIASTSYDNTMRINDLAKGKQVALKGHTDWITSFGMYQDRVITSSMDNTLRVWDSKAKRLKGKSANSWRTRDYLLDKSKKMLGLST